MRVNYLSILPGLGLLTVAEALSAQGPSLFRRAVTNPDEATGSGKTCADAFGPAYTECGTGTTGLPYCYDPSSEVCCDSTGAAWSCVQGEVCWTQDHCCQDGFLVDGDCTAPPGAKPSASSNVGAATASTGPTATSTASGPKGSKGSGSGSSSSTGKPSGAQPILVQGLGALWAPGIGFLVGGVMALA